PAFGIIGGEFLIDDLSNARRRQICYLCDCARADAKLPRNHDGAISSTERFFGALIRTLNGLRTSDQLAEHLICRAHRRIGHADEHLSFHQVCQVRYKKLPPSLSRSPC